MGFRPSCHFWGVSKNWQNDQKNTHFFCKKRKKKYSRVASNFAIFPKWPFLTPLKTPKNDPFFGPFSDDPNLEPKMTAFWPIFKKPQKRGFWGGPNLGPPLGVLVQKSPFLVKIGVFGTLKWPVFDHLLDHFSVYTPLLVSKRVKKWVQKVTKKWQKSDFFT